MIATNTNSQTLSVMLYFLFQEISLFNAALDGDLESLKCVLETEVLVDYTTPVRL